VKWSVVYPLRVAVVDDHSLIQMALQLRLSREPDFRVVGAFSSSRELIASLARLPVDLLVLDYALGAAELDGLHLIGLIRRRFPSMRILVASSAETPSVVNLSLAAGAHGFFGKSEDAELLVEAIRRVAQGHVYVSPQLLFRLGELPGTLRRPMAEMHGEQRLLDDPALSPKEREVLRCCLDGMSVSEISRKFMRSMKTISGQKQSAYRKLGVRSDAELFKLQHSLAET